MSKYTVMACNYDIVIEGFCPWCDGDAHFTPKGFEKPEGDLWEAEGFKASCSYEPEKGTIAHKIWSKIHARPPLDAAQKRAWDTMPERLKKEYRFYLHS